MEKSQKKISTTVLATAILCCCTQESLAQALRPSEGPGFGPPPAAITACEGLTENARCQFQTPRGGHSGQCRTVPGNVFACVPEGVAPPAGPPPARAPRAHDVVQAGEGPRLEPAVREPIVPGSVRTRVEGPWRFIEANGIAEHKTGAFPNAGNPNAIAEQRYAYRVPLVAHLTQTTYAALGQIFGVALNGVPFDPGAAEFYKGDFRSGWQYEPLSGAIPLGLDESYAHVQPNGAYHYHGLPNLLLQDLGVSAERHSPLIGWAADGLPIYALYGYSDPRDPASPIVEMTSAYRLKSGERSAENGGPGGIYDGTFTADYTYVAGAGTLEECNARYTVTPDFPAGTYAYFLTRDWPVIPRCFRAEVAGNGMRKNPVRQNR